MFRGAEGQRGREAVVEIGRGAKVDSGIGTETDRQTDKIVYLSICT